MAAAMDNLPWFSSMIFSLDIPVISLGISMQTLFLMIPEDKSIHNHSPPHTTKIIICHQNEPS